MTKSAKTRALEVCFDLNFPEIEDSRPFRIIYDALIAQAKETERDTRHACAVAIAHLPRNEPNLKSRWGSVDADAAHAACMNAKVE